MTRTAPPITLAGSQLGAVRHVCAFFANDDEEYRVLLPFIREGLSRGDKSVQVVNPEARQDHLQRLAGAGIDSAAPQQSGQLQIRINTEVYLRDGHFDQDRMLASIRRDGGFGQDRGRIPNEPHRVPDGLGFGRSISHPGCDRV